MHKMVLVIGDVPNQMDALQADGWCDSWAQGGRYTGALRLKEGAQGKMSGDAMRDVAEWMCQEVAWGVRPVDHTVYGGVNQAVVGDVDVVAATGGALVRDGKVELDYEYDLWTLPRVVMMVGSKKASEEDVASVERELFKFNALLGAGLADVPAEVTITVVDTHL
jgi:hypothetical protein